MLRLVILFTCITTETLSTKSVSIPNIVINETRTLFDMLVMTNSSFDLQTVTRRNITIVPKYIDSTDCPQDETYKRCGSCPQRCNKIKPHCARKCYRGCFCKKGLIRMDKLSRCVHKDVCLNILEKMNHKQNYEYVVKYL
nr:uncharacterized protein LOC111415965 [Onthophagus taurus]